MAYDFMKHFLVFENEERLNRLCQALEDVIRDLDEAEGKFSDAEVMQALDSVGFNLLRDAWEEFKKMENQRDFTLSEMNRSKAKKYLN